MDFIKLDDAELRDLAIGSAEIIGAIEDAFRDLTDCAVSAAPKTGVFAPDGRYMMATLSASDRLGVIAVKSVMVNDRNKARGLPGIEGAIMLLDAETAQLRAVLGAGWITAVRTAGLSAVAAKRLARPESASIGLIGTGVQAESHLRMFSELFPLERVRAHGRGQAGLDRIAAVAADLQLEFEQTPPRTCLEDADIVVTSVTLDHSIEPFLDARWLKTGAFAAITDLGVPWIGAGQNAFAALYVDDLAQEKIMEKPMVDPELITGELADFVSGKMRPGADGPSAFIFRGLAIGDLAVAALAYERARAKRGNA